MIDRQDTVFVKNSETNVITKRGPLYIEGYHLVETESGIVRVHDQIPRNVIGEFFDWLEEVELDHAGPFWGAITVVCIGILAFLSWLIFMLEPWTYGVDVSAGIVIATAVAYVVVIYFCGWEWIRAIVSWVNERRVVKGKA